MDFIDLKAQQRLIRDDLNRRISKVLDESHYIMGPEVDELEKKLAEFCGRKYCLSCSSGTDALVIPLMAYGLKETDAVFVPSFTFFASAESVVLAGGTPVFVDVDETFNISIDSLEKCIQNVLAEGRLKPAGIIPVDLFGLSADYERLLPIAEKYDLFVLEDAAQGFGGSLNGKRNGAFGNVSATSFFPAKPLGCYGDGGAIFTDDEDLYNRMKSIRVHGHGSDKYDNVRMGVNGRLDTIQAAILLSKLEIFENELEKRQQVAAWYNEQLEGFFGLPIIPDGCFSAWAQYTLKAENREQRDRIIAGMKGKNIPVMIYYPVPLHMQTAFKFLNCAAETLPVCKELAQQVFSLPMHPYLEKEDVTEICTALKAVCAWV